MKGSECDSVMRILMEWNGIHVSNGEEKGSKKKRKMSEKYSAMTFSTWPITLLEPSWNGMWEVEGAMSLLSLQDRLDQGMSLPVVPGLPLPPSSPYPHPRPVGASWSLPSPQSPSQVGPL